MQSQLTDYEIQSLRKLSEAIYSGKWSSKLPTHAKRWDGL